MKSNLNVQLLVLNYQSTSLTCASIIHIATYNITIFMLNIHSNVFCGE